MEEMSWEQTKMEMREAAPRWWAKTMTTRT
jgi:hypothetical protein